MALRKRKTAKVSRRPRGEKPERRSKRTAETEEVVSSGGSSAFTVDKVTLNTGAQRPVLIVEMTPVKKLVVKMSGKKLDTKSSRLFASMLSAIPGGEEVEEEEELDEEEEEEEDDEEEEDEDEEDDEEDEDESEEEEEEAPKRRSKKKPVAKSARGSKKVKLDLDELTEELEDEDE